MQRESREEEKRGEWCILTRRPGRSGDGGGAGGGGGGAALRHGPTDCLLLILNLIITSRSGSGSK